MSDSTTVAAALAKAQDDFAAGAERYARAILALNALEVGTGGDQFILCFQEIAVVLGVLEAYAVDVLMQAQRLMGGLKREQEGVPA